MKPIRSLAFVVNSDKPGAVELARSLVAVARAQGVRLKQTTHFPLRRGYLRGCDACCVIGGDGTLLGVVREAALEGVPIIGVNRGSLGFLTTFSPDEARAGFEGLLRGAFCVDKRAMLECSVAGAHPNLALNDVLIKDELSTGLVHLEVFADGELVTDYLCDGLIFSTATGSTAYNLSAGGPVVSPNMRSLVLTAVAPHLPFDRSLVLGLDEVVTLTLLEGRPASLVLDGSHTEAIAEGDAVVCSAADVDARFVTFGDVDFHAVLRSRFSLADG